MYNMLRSGHAQLEPIELHVGPFMTMLGVSVIFWDGWQSLLPHCALTLLYSAAHCMLLNGWGHCSTHGYHNPGANTLRWGHTAEARTFASLGSTPHMPHNGVGNQLGMEVCALAQRLHNTHNSPFVGYIQNNDFNKLITNSLEPFFTARTHSYNTGHGRLHAGTIITSLGWPDKM